MDYEKGIICRLLHSGEIKDVMDRQIHSDMFKDDFNKRVFSFVLEYYNKYGIIPTLEIMDNEFPDYKIVHIKEPILYCIDKVIENYVRSKGSKILLAKSKELVVNPLKGLDLLRDSFNQLTIEASPTEDSNIILNTSERKERYLRAKELKGLVGYPTAWDPINKATSGLHSEEFIVIVSRMGVGKTWFLLLMAEYAWRQGLSVLFISNEMAISVIERRFDAIHFKLPYQEFTEGIMANVHEERYFEGLSTLEKSDHKPMITLGNVGGVSSIASKIDQYSPHIVFVDGMYLLSDDRRGSNKWERTSNISWDLKRLTSQKKIPIVATTQFNREAEVAKFDQVNLAMLGFSDSIGQDASNVIGLFRNKDMELNKEMYIRMLKVREGEPKDFMVNWDLHYMDFSVLSEDDSNKVIEDNEIDDSELDY